MILIKILKKCNEATLLEHLQSLTSQPKIKHTIYWGFLFYEDERYLVEHILLDYPAEGREMTMKKLLFRWILLLEKL